MGAFDLTIAVCTYGDPSWQELAESRAVPSALDQAPVVKVHGTSLHGARNEALARVRSEWVAYVDGDDLIEPGYVEAMSQGSADLRAPSVRYVDGRREYAPRVPRVFGHRHQCSGPCLKEGNFIVVGAPVRTALVRRVGGWWGYEWSEDWDLWLRCWRAGGTVEVIPEAVYRAHVRPDSRNRAPDAEFKQRVHEQIYRANFPEEAAA